MQVLESRFQLQDERVWFGKAKLLADRIVLKGLGYHQKIALEDIVEIRWSADELIIVCRGGEEFDLRIKAAALWKYELQARCGFTDATNGPSGTGALPAASSMGDIAKEMASDGVDGEAGGTDDSATADADTNDSSGEQTDMFLHRESSYRIRNGFAEDRPQQPKRAEDPNP